MNKEQTFLQKLAFELYKKFESKLSDITIILPNKRAKVFLIEALKSHAHNTMFAPVIISIEDLIEELSVLKKLDNVELLFEFYSIYKKLTQIDKLQDFDQFANWAKILIQDFNEIDRYLLEPKKVFSYLSNLEVLKRWELEPNQTTDMIDNNIEFWSKLPLYYNEFYEHLKSNKVGYQGILYREAISNLDEYLKTKEDKSIIFAGFNALNQAEEIIFQKSVENNKAIVYWDIDAIFINDEFHDASLFIKKFKNKWPIYKSLDFEWIVEEFSNEKKIEIIGTPKTVGQAKIASSIINKVIEKDKNLNNVAIILGEENLLIPVLNALPQEVTALNITMGYSTKNNPAQILIDKIFKLHSNALSRPHNYQFYYKDLLDVLNHSLIKPIIKSEFAISVINKENISFINVKQLTELFKEDNPLFILLFSEWNSNIEQIIQKLLTILINVKDSLRNDVVSDITTKSFIYAIYKSLIQLQNYYIKYKLINSVSMLYSIYKQCIDLVEVSFEGEPLTGLQVMGVLESRVLDFESVIVTSLNEGVFPSGKSSNSFIPNVIKLELGLPTFKEKDAIYAYHFYHILLRAKNIYLLYNSDPSDGLDKGEVSRFIKQLEVEKQPKHNLTHKIYNAELPEKASQIKEINKTDLLLKRLQNIAQGKGFSPSSISNYLRSPYKFYIQRVLGVRDLDEVEENVAINTLGTIIHNTLEELYKPLLNKFLTENDILSLLNIYSDEVLKQFKNEYKQGEIKKGKNLIAFEVAKRNVYHFLKYELDCIKNGDAIKVIHLEYPLEIILKDAVLPYDVKIAGKVDRIEIRNNKYRIIDYKSGLVKQTDLNLNKWEDLTNGIKKEKILQLLCYGLMFKQKFNDLELEVGINSFKNAKAGFMVFTDKTTKTGTTSISDEIIKNFKSQVLPLISEILSSDVSFKEKN